MTKTGQLSKKNKIILYLLAAIGLVAVLAITVFAIVQNVGGNTTGNTDRAVLASNTWYASNGTCYWTFSEGHQITVYLRNSTEEEFLPYAQLAYALNEDYKQLRIGSDVSFSDADIYTYEFNDGYLLLYNVKYQEKGEKQLPTLIFSKTPVA